MENLLFWGYPQGVYETVTSYYATKYLVCSIFFTYANLAGTKEAVSVELLTHPLRHQLDPPGYIIDILSTEIKKKQFLEEKWHSDLPGPAAVPLSSLGLLSLSSLSGGSTAMS